MLHFVGAGVLSLEEIDESEYGLELPKAFLKGGKKHEKPTKRKRGESGAGDEAVIEEDKDGEDGKEVKKSKKKKKKKKKAKKDKKPDESAENVEETVSGMFYFSVKVTINLVM